jgi:hypothetical protein
MRKGRLMIKKKVRKTHCKKCCMISMKSRRRLRHNKRMFIRSWRKDGHLERRKCKKERQITSFRN